MAQKTAAEILNEINTLLADNSQGDISAEDVRSVLTDIKDSFVNLTDAGITTAEAGFLAGVTSAIQSQIDGKLSNSGGTLTGNLFMNNNLPAYYLIESDGNPDFDRVLINLASGQFRISTRDSNNTPISNDYTIDRDANGATRHSFKIADSNVLRIDANGINLNDLDITDVRAITQSKSASGNGVDLTHSGTGNALQITKTNSGEAVDVVSGTVRIQSLTADRWLFIDSNNRVTVKTNAELLTAIGAITELSDDTTPQLGGNLNLNGNNVGNASAADLQKLSQLTATSTELNYVDGVTSSIQTQLNNKLENVVEDTTPQLGGSLDAQSNDITNINSLGATTIEAEEVIVNSGATGTFVTTDEKTVTVTNGIITNIA